MSSDRAAPHGERNPKVAVTHMLSDGNYFKSAGQITYSVGFVNLPKCDLPKKKKRKKKKTPAVMFIQRFFSKSVSTADTCKCLIWSLFLPVAEGNDF